MHLSTGLCACPHTIHIHRPATHRLAEPFPLYPPRHVLAAHEARWARPLETCNGRTHHRQVPHLSGHVPAPRRVNRETRPLQAVQNRLPYHHALGPPAPKPRLRRHSPELVGRDRRRRGQSHAPPEDHRATGSGRDPCTRPHQSAQAPANPRTSPPATAVTHPKLPTAWATPLEPRLRRSRPDSFGLRRQRWQRC